jgi:hypothetical protein
MSDQPDEETDEPLIANDRNYFKVEKWTKDAARSIACFMLATVFFGLSPCLKRQSSTGSGSG